MPGYFEANVSVSKKCSTGCSSCRSVTSCVACLPRFYYNQTTSECHKCPFDCYTCAYNGSCLSCNSKVDFREINESRCVPIVGYFESNHSQNTIATKCPHDCSACSSY